LARVKKKIKVVKTSTLKKKLWKLFSEYIRRRDKGICFTCHLTKHYKQMQAGHFISKAVGGIGLYFHEKNVHCQCYRCNINLGGNGAVYAKRIIEIYGVGTFEKLFYIKNQCLCKWTPEIYESKIKYYKAKLKEMDVENVPSKIQVCDLDY